MITILLFWEISTPVLTDVHSLEFEWQQISWSVQDSSQYSGQSYQYCSLGVLHLCSYFRFLQFLYQSFGDCTEHTNYNWYYRHFHVPYFFQFPNRSRYLSLFSLSGMAKSSVQQVLFFFCWLSLGLVIWPRLSDPFISQNLREVCVSHATGWISGCAYTICSYGQISLTSTISSGSPSSPSHV